MFALLSNLFRRYADRHVRLEGCYADPPLILRLERNRLEVRGQVPVVSPGRLYLELGGVRRSTDPDPGTGDFSLAIPFSPGSLRLWLEDASAPLGVGWEAEVAGFSKARVRFAALLLLPGFLMRLVRLAPAALRWVRSRDPAARAAVREVLGLAPLTPAMPLEEGMLPAPGEAPSPAGGSGRAARAPLLIILPVHDAFDQLREALARLERHTPEPWHLILIEDRSRDPQLRPWLREWVERVNSAGGTGRVELLENAGNLGFIRTANRGFCRALEILKDVPDEAGAAIVLLNSDAFVPPNWAARLLEPIAADGQVASVTPMSNDGELLSVPFPSCPQRLEPGMADAIDRVAAGLAVPPGGGPAMPTGVGFCMAISLAWLRRAGLFDTAFGAGYGEEVDWCRRAGALGGLHVAQPALFVEHVGAGSFGAAEKRRLLAANGAMLSRRYPDFDREVRAFVEDDPLLTPRLILGLVWAAQQARARDQGPVPVYLAHSLGGGAEMDLARRLRGHVDDAGAAVVLRVGAGRGRWQIELHGPGGVVMGSTSDAGFLKRLLGLLPARRLIYSCAVGDSDPAGIPDLLLALGDARAGGWEVLFHDYLPLSPSYTLLGDDGLFHGLPMPGEHHDRAHEARRPDGSVVDLGTWRRAWGRLVAAADRLVVFSSGSRDLVAAAWPHVSGRIVECPHPPLHDVPRLESVPGDVPVIGVPGNIAPHKGAPVLAELSRLLARSGQARLVLLGKLDPAFRLVRPAVVHGGYAPEDIPALVDKYRISAWLIPSLWPETFSFVTHEALATGLPVFAFDLGAQGDLVRASGQGEVIPLRNGWPDMEFLLDRILGLLHGAQGVAGKE